MLSSVKRVIAEHEADKLIPACGSQIGLKGAVKDISSTLRWRGALLQLMRCSCSILTRAASSGEA